MKRLLVAGLFCLLSLSVMRSQQLTSVPNEKKVPLSEPAIALDAGGSSALEATLATPNLSGNTESPVTNVRLIVRNTSGTSFAFVSGVATFYDSGGVRCAEGVFKSDVLAVGEQFETDLPGIRIRCAATNWRVVATSLVSREVPITAPVQLTISNTRRLVISIDGEVHPIQLDKPIKLTFGDKERTIIVREEP